MVFADRTLKAGSLEVKSAYQPITTEYENGILKITNRFDFTNLNEYILNISVCSGGKTLSEKEITVDLEPHETIEIIPETNDVDCEISALLNIKLIKNKEVIAQTQHIIMEKHNALFEISKPATLTQDNENIYANGESFEYIFSKHYGSFESIKINGKEQISKMPIISTHRASTDNERNVVALWNNINIWQGENIDAQFSKIYDLNVQDNKIVVNGSLAGVSRKPYFHYTAIYEIFENGSINVKLIGNVREDTTWLPRLGFEFTLPDSSKDFAYYGRGPIENYIDSCHSSFIGNYESDTDNEYVNYVRPQEHGNHTNTRMLKIGDMLFTSKSDFEFNVSNYSIEAIEKARHTDELIKDNNIHLRIDYKNSGLGSNSCGPQLQKQYRLDEKDIDFEFAISIYENELSVY